MEGVWCLMWVVICGSALVVIGEAKFLEGHDKRKDMSEETLLLRDKLNVILDAESKEVNLLKNLLDEEQDEVDAKKREEEKEEDVKSVVVPEEEKSEGVGRGSVKYLREHGIVSKLEENSKRMEKMVVFLVDLRNLLTEALTQQNRQMAVESEMVEMREEMEYLRKELHSIKTKESQTHHSTPISNDGNPTISTSSLENTLHNEHVTLEWLKNSHHELRREISELSDQCNATLLVSLQKKMEGAAKNRDENLAQAERELDTLKLAQLRTQEDVKEAKENIRDLRSWQVKMGTKLVAHMSTGNSEGENEETNEIESEQEERTFITEALKDAVGKPNLRHHLNHKRLKSKVHQLQTLIDDLLQSNKNHERRISKLENSQRTLKSLLSATSLSSSSGSRGRLHRSVDSSRNLQSLEKRMEEYVLTLEQLNDKVSGMDELQESSTQLFQSLEQLEKKYDDRVGEIQTGLARLESGVSGVLVTNEDLKEQQSQQSSVIQSVKKDLFQVKGKLQTNHLRLAAIQSQMVRWASAKCSDENSESIQNIRIATLEHALLDHNNSKDNEEEEGDSQDEENEMRR